MVGFLLFLFKPTLWRESLKDNNHMSHNVLICRCVDEAPDLEPQAFAATSEASLLHVHELHHQVRFLESDRGNKHVWVDRRCFAQELFFVHTIRSMQIMDIYLNLPWAFFGGHSA